MHRYAYPALAIALAFATPARADICGDYRMTIDSYIATTNAGAAVKDALKAAKSGTRAARASRTAVKALKQETTREIIDIAGAIDSLEAADTASTATGEAFEALYKSIKDATTELAKKNTMALEEARSAADEAAVAALDSLSRFKAMTRKTALKATSTAAATSPGATTSKALIATHENIFGAACE